MCLYIHSVIYIPYSIIINILEMSSTVEEITSVIKAMVAELKKARTETSRLLREKSKMEGKMVKLEAKLAMEKTKTGGKKATEATAVTEAAATVAAASSSVDGSVDTGVLSAAAVAETEDVKRLTHVIERLSELPGQIKGISKPVKKVKAERDEPWVPTSASFAFRPSELYAAEWEAFKVAGKAQKDVLNGELATLDDSQSDRIAEIKKEIRAAGSLPSFTMLCKTETHKAEWEAFEAKWKLEHPKKVAESVSPSVKTSPVASQEPVKKTSKKTAEVKPETASTKTSPVVSEVPVKKTTKKRTVKVDDGSAAGGAGGE